MDDNKQVHFLLLPKDPGEAHKALVQFAETMGQATAETQTSDEKSGEAGLRRPGDL